MRLTLRFRGPAVLALLAGLLVCGECSARFANLWRPVPLERLLRNVGQRVEKNPKDAEAHYTLGRLHSLAFAQDAGEVDVQQGDGLPSFPPYSSIQVQREKGSKPGPGALQHLSASVRQYTQAARLDPKSGLYQMGLGWMLEQGLPFAGAAAAPWQEKSGRAPASEWKSRALQAYRKAYALEVQADLKRDALGPGGDPAISLEAGEGILRLLRGRTDAAAKAEAARVKPVVAKLANLPRIVTPIIFPLDGPAPLESLLAARPARFDLAGSGRAESWSWVNSRAGILVWDPDETGRITSGTQMFGSFTWSMFWPDGYAPLAALDDDGDGRLTGRELRGLAVWRDADGDGRSGPGEVLSVSRCRIAALACRAEGRSETGPYHPQGVELEDGRRLPTYDWISRRRP